MNYYPLHASLPLEELAAMLWDDSIDVANRAYYERLEAVRRADDEAVSMVDTWEIWG